MIYFSFIVTNVHASKTEANI